MYFIGIITFAKYSIRSGSGFCDDSGECAHMTLPNNESIKNLLFLCKLPFYSTLPKTGPASFDTGPQNCTLCTTYNQLRLLVYKSIAMAHAEKCNSDYYWLTGTEFYPMRDSVISVCVTSHE